MVWAFGGSELRERGEGDEDGEGKKGRCEPIACGNDDERTQNDYMTNSMPSSLLVSLKRMNGRIRPRALNYLRRRSEYREERHSKRTIG